MRKMRLAKAAMLATMMLALPPGAVGCGYHDDVSLARGLLNWVYPDALHVVGAISSAVAEKRLPAPASPGAGFVLFGYHATVRALEWHEHQLHMSSGGTSGPTFSLLLIEPMLWARFVFDGSDMRMQIHVSGPQAGDLVVISGEAVVREIANRRLSLGEAYRQGLIRLYGPAEQAAAFLKLYHQVGDARSDH